MKVKASKIILLLAAFNAAAHADPLLIEVAAQDNGLGLSDGTDFSIGYILRVGYFDVSDALIIANITDYGYLNSHWFQFGQIESGKVLGAVHPELASSQFYDSLTGDPTQSGPQFPGGSANFIGKNIVLWAFNQTSLPGGSDYDSGTEIGIFRSPNVFPDGNPGSTDAGFALDATSIIPGSADIIFGGYGVGTVDPAGPNPGGAPLYNTAVVPEPSAAVALISGIAMLCGVRRRRFNA